MSHSNCSVASVCLLTLLITLGNCQTYLTYGNNFTGTVTFYPDETTYNLSDSALYDGTRNVVVLGEDTIDSFLMELEFDGVYELTDDFDVYWTPATTMDTSTANTTYIEFYNYTTKTTERVDSSDISSISSSGGRRIRTTVITSNQVTIFVTFSSALSSGGLTEVEIAGTFIATPEPTQAPTAPSQVPSSVPSSIPSSVPSGVPSGVPSSIPSAIPSGNPTVMPTAPTVSVPTNVPTNPTLVPSNTPTEATMSPSMDPSSVPTDMPTSMPTTIDTANTDQAFSVYYNGYVMSLFIGCAMLFYVVFV